MQALSIDLRERIVFAYENGEGSYAKVAKRFVVSKGVVVKLVHQYRELGTLQPQTHRRGRHRVIQGELENRLEEHIQEQPDATLEERIEELELDCCINTMWHAVRRLGKRFKKKSEGSGAGTGRCRSEATGLVGQPGVG